VEHPVVDGKIRRCSCRFGDQFAFDGERCPLAVRCTAAALGRAGLIEAAARAVGLRALPARCRVA
jgi:hypothetical protein